MNDTHAPRPGHMDDERLAPHLEAAWRDEFVFELRMLDVPGDVIGDALVTADTHVAESGETAQEAFGDPTVYAQEIAGSTSRRVDPRLSVRSVVGVVAGVAGTLGAIASTLAWLDGTPVRLSVGMLSGLALALVVAGVLLVRSTWALRLMKDRTVLAALLFGAVPAAAVVGLIAIGRDPVLEGSPRLLGVLSVVLLAVNALTFWLDPEDDRILGPGDDRRLSRTARLGAALSTPGTVAVICAFLWLVN